MSLPVETPPLAGKPHSNVPYVVAIVLVTLFGVVTILGITVLRPEKDNTVLITTVIGFLLPTTMALLAFLKTQETNLTVNSRMDEMKDMIRKTAYANGIMAGSAMKTGVVAAIGGPVPVGIPAPAPVVAIETGDTVKITKGGEPPKAK